MQANEMRFVRKIKEVVMLEKRCSTAIRKQSLCAKMNGKRPARRPQTRWFDFIGDTG